jgi:hypothetical protein
VPVSEGRPPAPSEYADQSQPLPPQRDAAPGPAPPRPSKPRGSRARGLRDFLLFQDSQVQGMACGLVALSAADLFMTFALLRRSTLFFESNPVAGWFFAKWNIAGMVGFKFSVIAAVVALSEFIERRRPGWGRFVLLVGCVGAAYAVYKGFNLYISHQVPPPADVE